LIIACQFLIYGPRHIVANTNTDCTFNRSPISLNYFHVASALSRINCGIIYKMSFGLFYKYNWYNFLTHISQKSAEFAATHHIKNSGMQAGTPALMMFSICGRSRLHMSPCQHYIFLPQNTQKHAGIFEAAPIIFDNNKFSYPEFRKILSCSAS